jgi:hypothetical protein
MAPSGILLDQLRQLDQIIALGHRNPSELPNSTPDQPLTKRVPVLKSAFKAVAEAKAKAKATAKAKAKASKTVPRAESAQLAAARALGGDHGSAVLLKTKDEQSARVSRKTCNEEKSTAAHALQVCAA